jgi:hypothetical protein
MEKLSKTSLPPKIKYRIRKWIETMRHAKPNMSNKDLAGNIVKKFEEALAIKELKKNQVMASMYKSGGMRLDFGMNVSEKAKKAALEWAKKKGLQIETSELAKSVAKSNKLEFGDCRTDECIKRVIWEC